MSSASDYWRVTAIGAVAATFSEADVAVFSSSYRVMWIVSILASALASAMSIRLNVCLGANQPINSKFVAAVGVSLIATVIGVTTIVLFFTTQAGFVGKIFSVHNYYYYC